MRRRANRWPTLWTLLVLVSLPGRLAAQDIEYDFEKHPMARRTLRTTYRAPEGAAIKVAFFDADSTLRVSRSGGVSASAPDDVMILPGVPERLIELSRQSYLVAIVSNQGGIPRFVSLTTADAALRHTITLLNRRGATVDYYDFAESKDGFRKPATGMADLLAHVVRIATGKEIDWSSSIMVGDSAWKSSDRDPEGRAGVDFSSSDRLFAENLRRQHGGVAFHYPSDFFGWRARGVVRFDNAQQVEEFVKLNPDFPAR